MSWFRDIQNNFYYRVILWTWVIDTTANSLYACYCPYALLKWIVSLWALLARIKEGHQGFSPGFFVFYPSQRVFCALFIFLPFQIWGPLGGVLKDSWFKRCLLGQRSFFGFLRRPLSKGGGENNGGFSLLSQS